MLSLINLTNLLSNIISTSLIILFTYSSLTIPKLFLSNKALIKQIDCYRYEYTNNKLTKYEVLTKGDVITYEYNLQGLRKYKNLIINNVQTDELYYKYSGCKLVTEIRDNYSLDFLYDERGLLYGFIYRNQEKFYYIRDVTGLIIGIALQNGEKVVEYNYDAWGNMISITDISYESIGTINPIRYKGYYYDVETNLALVSSRYYSPELGRFIQPADVSSLNPQSINGLNLYTYAHNNPISFSYNNSSAISSTSVGGGLAGSIGAGSSSNGNVNSGAPSKGGLNLGWLKNGLDTGSTIHGLYTSISGLVNHTAYFAKNLTPFSDDMTMLGVSMKDGVLAFNKFSWGLDKLDKIGIALGVGLDVYDSIQRGVSPGGVVLGATLTAAKGVGLIYLNKGIMYAATAIGSCFGPVGTAVGFVVGGIVCIIVDIFVSNWLDDLIDKIAK